MQGYKLIGKGTFSKVYRKGDENVVAVHSTDPAKECMSLGFFPDSRLFPKITRVSVGEECTLYTMAYYPKVRAPKKVLNTRDYELYRLLRDISSLIPCDSERYNTYMTLFDAIPDKFAAERKDLVEALTALSNYGQDIGFEISPRNISATADGDLILLDCFFFVQALLNSLK